MKVTITTEHLDKAIAARESGEELISTCLMAQALKEAFVTEDVICGSDSADINHRSFTLLGSRELISKFDSAQYVDLRALLPAYVHAEVV